MITTSDLAAHEYVELVAEIERLRSRAERLGAVVGLSVLFMRTPPNYWDVSVPSYVGQPLVRWHRKGEEAKLRSGLYWRCISKPGPGRPPIPEALRALIRQLASENNWRAWKIHAELGKLGFTVSLATVSRYLPKQSPDRGKQQRWGTFLQNHKDAITAMDFFVVPTQANGVPESMAKRNGRALGGIVQARVAGSCDRVQSGPAAATTP